MSIISEISETLSLTSKPKQLLETTLDTLAGALNADCCWIQLVNLGNDRLPLAASLGFTSDMKREMASMDVRHRFSHEIIGLGHRIVIPSLNRNGKYNVPVFRKAGFRSLVAVPIMTYRIHGILGIAYQVRMKFSEDYTQLLTVIANLIGMSLNKSTLNRLQTQKKQPESRNTTLTELDEDKSDIQKTAVEAKGITDSKQSYTDKTEEHSTGFHEHSKSMKQFNKSHK